MALLVSALALLLALPPLLSTQGAGQASSSRGGESKTPGTCRMEGGWTTKVTFSPEQTAFGVNDTVQVTCLAAPEAGQFPANCTELKDRGAVWDISGVKCLRMCNDWAKQVDFDPAQLEFGAGAEVLVTCRQQFQQLSFKVTCNVTASGRFEWDFGDHTCVRKCKIPKTWDPRLQFAPEGQFYALNESVTLSCREGYRPSPSVISCIRIGSQSVWSETPTCRGVCTTMAGDWPPSVTAVSTQTEFAVGEGVEVTCRQEQYEVLTFHMQCTERAGQATWDTSNVRCVEKCQKPSGDPALRFEPDKSYYGSGESVTLSCPEGFEPSQPEIRCIRLGSRNGWSGTAACREKCKAPSTSDSRVQFDLNQQFYSPGDSVTWRCPAGYRPSPPEISCTRRGSRSEWSGTAACTGVCTTTAGDWPPSVAAGSTQTEFAVGERVWVWCRPEQYEGSSFWMQCTDRAGRVAWEPRRVSCIEKCRRPQWDDRLRFEPDRPFYGQNEQTTLSCPGDSQPSLSEIVCVRRAQNSDSRNAWAVWDSRGAGRLLTENVTCVEIPEIIPGDLEVSPTTIKLRWTCSPAKSCQGSWKIHARCQPDGPLSGPCPRPTGTKAQTSQGLEGTLTCSSLQPFTSYKVTVSGGYPGTNPARSTVLYSQRVRTSETAPDRPETEPLDLTTQTVSWKELQPCKGTIVGYQLNITAWREYNSSFLEGKVLRVNQSVTKYRLRPWRHGTNYTVTIQGLTAAGPGQASRWDFETEISEPAIQPDVTALSVYNISLSSGTAVLPLQPIPGLHGPIREYQIIVSAMQNGSGADACHAPDLQPFNASLERAAYLAAVLPAHNLTGLTAFVLGDGARHNGYLNAPLRPSRNYTAFVRVVSRWKQVEKSSCVRYNFSIDACRMEGGWTTKVTFSPEQTAFGVNDMVLVTCLAASEAGQFPAMCIEVKDRGAVWDISGVKCLRMCNNWAMQVDFDPAQLEFSAGAEVLVTCRQQFQQLSFKVTCTEMASGRFEWDFGDHTCVREAQRDPPGGAAVAVAVPVLVLATGALLLGFVCCRKREALASRFAKDAGEALYTELQPRDAPDIYCTIQTQVQGAAGKDLAPPAPQRTEEIWEPPTAAAGPRAKRQRTREQLASDHEN